MAVQGLVVRSGIGSWTTIQDLITRGLEIGEAVAIPDTYVIAGASISLQPAMSGSVSLQPALVGSSKLMPAMSGSVQ